MLDLKKLTLSSSAPPGDLELAVAARQDPAAFSELYRRHFQRVYAYQMLHTANPEDAQDLTSQTFMAALESIRRFRGEGSFAAWLMRIAHNQMAGHYRRKRDRFNLDLLDSLPGRDALPEEQAIIHVRLVEISAALGQLPELQSEALALRVFGGLSTAETAAVLEKSEAAVKMLVYRAVQGLRQGLSTPLEEIE